MPGLPSVSCTRIVPRSIISVSAYGGDFGRTWREPVAGVALDCDLRFVIGHEPGEAFVETVAAGGARWLHVPVAVADACQAQLLLDLVRLHRCTITKHQSITTSLLVKY